jgi:hypothetical protein
MVMGHKVIPDPPFPIMKQKVVGSGWRRRIVIEQVYPPPIPPYTDITGYVFVTYRGDTVDHPKQYNIGKLTFPIDGINVKPNHHIDTIAFAKKPNGEHLTRLTESDKAIRNSSIKSLPSDREIIHLYSKSRRGDGFTISNINDTILNFIFAINGVPNAHFLSEPNLFVNTFDSLFTSIILNICLFVTLTSLATSKLFTHLISIPTA